MNIIVPLGVIGGGALLGLVVFEVLYHFLANPEDKLEYAKQKAEKKAERDAKRAERAEKRKEIATKKSRNQNALELRKNISTVVENFYKGYAFSGTRVDFLRSIFIEKGAMYLGRSGLKAKNLLPDNLLYVKETDEERALREKTNKERNEAFLKESPRLGYYRENTSYADLKPAFSEAHDLFENFFNEEYISERELEEISYLVALKLECYMPSFTSALALYLSEPTTKLAEKLIETLVEVSIDTVLPLLAVKKEEVEINKTVKEQLLTNVNSELEEDMEFYRKTKIKN